MAVGFACIFLVLCVWTVKPVVEVDLPSDGSFWMANLSTDIFAVQPVLSCGAGESLSGDAFEDVDDAIIYIRGVKFFAWTGISSGEPGACPPILWRPLPKIPIA